MSKASSAASFQHGSEGLTDRPQFSERLRTIMEERGLTVTEVADRMRRHLHGENFATSNLSHYRQGRSIPRDGHLKALILALGVRPGELLSGGDRSPAPVSSMGELLAVAASAGSPSGTPIESGEPCAQSLARHLTLEDHGSEVRIQIDQRVPWDVALKILQTLKGSSIN